MGTVKTQIMVNIILVLVTLLLCAVTPLMAKSNIVWEMPTKDRPLIVGVPGEGSFDNFVKITHDNISSETFFNGFCIEVFREVLKTLYHRKSYHLPVEFRKFDGSYNDLVDHLANGVNLLAIFICLFVWLQTFDAIVGDLTINAERWDKVEFTEPFTESGLVTVVPVRSADKGWIFFKPFKLDMWLATGGLLLYTMFMVWFMEHRSNPDFSGSWKDQVAHSLWFAFTSLFLAHREKITSNYTRVVVVVWLFVALVLTQSFTASLTSMLTIPRLSSIDINSLGRSNKRVGCDENEFMNNFLKETLGYKAENVVSLSTEAEYIDAFENGRISAAILEIPYAKVFVNKNCNKYTITGSTYRFGGFGFAFQKGSQLARNVSKAILVISEKGTLKRLEEEFLTVPSSQCSLDLTNAKDVDGLSLQNFWGLFVFSLAISTTSFLLFVACLLKNYWSQISLERNLNRSVWGRTIKLARYLSNAEVSPRAPDPGQELGLQRMPIHVV
ncbi:glutamate receptor 2.8-like [Impatiens glandulifera]|uniref:glutamate receptor 2.8-like n=1 Tax=Impatiens glandulifera TaxID=253017 RepID=UPI001FB1738B|nr:glutamate receptor 2.8-like [Impatiens glandulifera]